MPIANDLTQCIGNTPLVSFARYARAAGVDAHILGKLESRNPGGSIKDRAALYMIRAAEQAGILREGGVIVEPTSGNTGIGLAAVAKTRGYRVILTMPESMSAERRALLAAYGAELVLTPASAGMQGAVERAQAIAKETPGAFVPGQFDNPANAQAHYETTAPEIWRDTQGQLDALVCGVGTGGTITGCGRYLKEKNADIHIVAVEPADSPLLSRGVAGAHGIQGIGANFVPGLLDRAVIDQIIAVETGDAIACCRTLAGTQGYLVGISSGAALHAATVLACQPGWAKKRIGVVLPDGGERYMSLGVF